MTKKSIFASPDNVNGRVGIGTCGMSGKPMTEFTTAEKWRKGVWALETICAVTISGYSSETYYVAAFLRRFQSLHYKDIAMQNVNNC